MGWMSFFISLVRRWAAVGGPGVLRQPPWAALRADPDPAGRIEPTSVARPGTRARAAAGPAAGHRRAAAGVVRPYGGANPGFGARRR